MDAGLLSSSVHPVQEVPLQATPVERQMLPLLCSWKTVPPPGAIALVAELLSS
jgi:hypothetical protein